MDARRACFVACIVLTLASADAALAAEPAALAKARALYNAGSYDAAIDSATAARRDQKFADAAAIVLARAHLERYRQGANPADLAVARETLGSVRVAALSPRDQVDLLIGFGQTLYFGELFGAAAELFDTALSRGAALDARDHASLLDWWATALNRDAQSRPADRRGAVYARISSGMTEQLRGDPGNPVANYWLAMAARGSGDFERAWDAAVAAWVRASLSPATMARLRGDLDRLVTEALIPERARTRPAREQAETTAMLRAQWEGVKQSWK